MSTLESESQSSAMDESASQIDGVSFEDLYDRLTVQAERLMRNERRDHTLDARSLVHEAWLRIAGGPELSSDSARYVFGAAVQAMRRVLVDHARRHVADRRGGANKQRWTLRSSDLTIEMELDELLALDEALEELGKMDGGLLKVVELRFFGGLGVAEVAALVERSERSVKRDWAWARAWLYRRLRGEGSSLSERA